MLSFFVYSNPKMNTSSSQVLEEQIASLDALINDRDALDLSVSKVSVAWHLDHSLKTIIGICEALQHSNPKTYKWRANVSRTMSLTFNYIPRGRAQSPKSVLPPQTILTKDLYKQLFLAKSLLKEAILLPDQSYFKHPVFGTINKGETLRFLEVHTEHHLKIIRDILAANLQLEEARLLSSI